MSPRLAEEAIHSRLTCLPIESLPLTQCVGGTLRENIYAERDHPPFDRVTMDGIAVDSAALRRGLKRFRIQATQAAGTAAIKLAAADDAIEVMTGAVLPLGSDCVIPVEQLEIDASSPKDSSKLKGDEKKKMEEQQKVLVQKNNAAVDELQAVVGRFNEQLKIFKAKQK